MVFETSWNEGTRAWLCSFWCQGFALNARHSLSDADSPGSLFHIAGAGWCRSQKLPLLPQQ